VAIPTLHLGLIGAGRIGCMHAENLARRIPSARLLLVADIDKEAAAKCAERNDIPEAVGDYSVVLNHPDIRAIVICSATHTHAMIVEAAAAAGKHILCEKPLALSLAEIDRALAAVTRAGVKMQVGFNRRFDANSQRVRQAVAQGEIGQPQRLHIISRDPSPPPLEYLKTSGGIFLDMTIHDFDLARFLIGSEVVEVYSAGEALGHPDMAALGDLDTVVTLLRFANGVIGTIDNSREAVYGYDQRVEAFGSGGVISTGNQYPNNAVLSTAQGVRRDLPLHFFLERYADSYLAEMKAFVAAVLGDSPVPVTGEDGRMATALALAARRSLEANRSVGV